MKNRPAAAAGTLKKAEHKNYPSSGGERENTTTRLSQIPPNNGRDEKQCLRQKAGQIVQTWKSSRVSALNFGKKGLNIGRTRKAENRLKTRPVAGQVSDRNQPENVGKHPEVRNKTVQNLPSRNSSLLPVQPAQVVRPAAARRTTASSRNGSSSRLRGEAGNRNSS
ncbi:hypothetical protein Salat_2770300 [Sesamum alatum]|uniref:Uncharacterized protein n=1 Tax=Sesamum alatum TaxID=300844 RepID=A0AAE1XKM4_9LAMI|nr:hypothetical protein Salat_2770300 [Sesamum alatum]